jgi:DNA-directed RNA polymerase specialized sigma24 family protein
MVETFSQSSFHKLLGLLAPEREAAGEKYENLRQRLIKFFEWRNCEMAEELTDTVFDRVMQKIAEGEQINNVTGFSATVAQFVFKEYLRRNERQNQLIEGAPEIQNIKASEPVETDENSSVRLICFDKCLKEFSDENRKFIIAYYDTDERTMINSRKKLAEEMKVSLNTLLIKACRLKAKLEDCTLSCSSSRQFYVEKFSNIRTFNFIGILGSRSGNRTAGLWQNYRKKLY